MSSTRQPDHFKDQTEYIVALYNNWEKQDPENNTSKLHRLLDSDSSYHALRRFLKGQANNDFSLFEAFLRSIEVDPENYRAAITRWYPSMLKMAERIHASGRKFDQAGELKASSLDLYQRLMTSEPLTKKYINKEWGRTGISIAEKAIAMEQVKEDLDKVLRVNSKDQNIYLGRHVVAKLIEHNSREYYDQENPSDLDLCYYRVFSLTKTKAKEFKAKAEDFYAFIDENANETEKGSVVFAMQTLFRAIHFI